MVCPVVGDGFEVCSQIHSEGLANHHYSHAPTLKKFLCIGICKPNVEEEEPIQDDDKCDNDNMSVAIASKIRIFSKLQIRCHAASRHQSTSRYLENTSNSSAHNLTEV